MARRRGRARGINFGHVALAVGGLAALALLVQRVSAWNPIRNINVEVYEKKSCVDIAQNPTGDDPTDNNTFTYDVVWIYTETEAGKLPVRTVKGRVGTVTASRGSPGLINIEYPENPIPEDIKAENRAHGAAAGYEPNSWYESKCAIGEMCHGDHDCCIFNVKVPFVTPTTFEHKLSYYIIESYCLDCHYTSCQPTVFPDGTKGQEIPKGGGTSAVFKYSRNTDSCITPTGCKQAPEGGCWYNDQYGRYKGKCYIIIR